MPLLSNATCFTKSEKINKKPVKKMALEQLRALDSEAMINNLIQYSISEQNKQQ